MLKSPKIPKFRQKWKSWKSKTKLPYTLPSIESFEIDFNGFNFLRYLGKNE